MSLITTFSCYLLFLRSLQLDSNNSWLSIDKRQIGIVKGAISYYANINNSEKYDVKHLQYGEENGEKTKNPRLKFEMKMEKGGGFQKESLKVSCRRKNQNSKRNYVTKGKK